MEQVDFISLAKQVISDIMSVKEGSISDFYAPTYYAIMSNGEIEDSELPYILRYAEIAVVMLPYSYTMITKDWCSRYIIFIDGRGIPNNKIQHNGWTLKFDTPITDYYKTKVRYAIISNHNFEFILPVEENIEPTSFHKVWRLFSRLTPNTDFYEIKLLTEAYRQQGGCPDGYNNIVIKKL